MGVYRRKLKKDWRWFYSGQYLGVKYHSKAIFLTKQEAGRAERVKKAQMDKEARSPTKDILLLDLINDRLDYVASRRSKAYYKDSQKYLKLFYNYVGNPMASKIGGKQVNNFLMYVAKDLKNRKKTNSKVNAIIRALKALFNYGIDICEIDMKNPAGKVKFYSMDTRIKYIPTDSEIELVKAECDPGQKMLIDFVRHTGCRINEALRLTTADIGEKYVILYTRKAQGGSLTPRRVPKPDCLVGVKLKKGVFSRWSREPKFLARKVEKLKLKRWNWHNLRHKRASEWSAEGKPLFEIMSLLGHSNLKTTQNYLHLLSLANL